MADLSPDSLELLLTKLARLRLKVAVQKRQEAAEWAALPAAEHRQAAWQLQADRERLAELEVLLWLATREKEYQEAEAEVQRHLESQRALRASRPTLVPMPATDMAKPVAPTS